MSGKTDNRTSYLWSRHKAVRRHICHNIRLGIILHGQRQGTVIFRSRSYLHTVCHFLLHHNRNRVNRHFSLKQSHDNRRCNVIGQIRHNFNGFSTVALLCQLSDVYFQYIFIENRYILIILKRVLQNGN